MKERQVQNLLQLTAAKPAQTEQRKPEDQKAPQRRNGPLRKRRRIPENHATHDDQKSEADDTSTKRRRVRAPDKAHGQHIVSRKCILTDRTTEDQGFHTLLFCERIAKLLRQICYNNYVKEEKYGVNRNKGILKRLRKSENDYGYELEVTIERFLRKFNFSKSVILAAFVYVDRLQESEELGIRMVFENAERFFCMCVLLAAKNFEDGLVFNVDLLHFCRFDDDWNLVNDIELLFLRHLDWRLHVSLQQYCEYEAAVLGPIVQKNLKCVLASAPAVVPSQPPRHRASV